MNEETRARDERLRAILREGDPAGDEPGPAAEEVRRLRRAVLARATEPRRRILWVPAAALAAAAALTLAIALGLWRSQNDAVPPARETGRRAAVETAPPAPLPAPPPPVAAERAPEGVSYAPIVAPAPPVELRRAEAPRRSRARREVRPAVPEPDPPALEPVQLASLTEETPEAAEPDSSLVAEEAEEAEVRQVQFDAPAGTRVIWMLSSESVVEDTIK